MSTVDPQETPPTAPATQPKPHKWRRRLKRTAITLIVAAVALRIIMIFALPVVLRRVAAFYDMQLQYDRVSLAVVGGNAQLWGVKVTPKTGGEPILVADYLYGDILPLKLLSGKLHVLRAEADGVDLTLHRTADGKIPLLEQLTAGGAAAPSNPANPTIDFTSPLTVEALRLNKVRARVRDDAVEPKLDAQFAMDLRVSHVGAAGDIPVVFEINAWSEQVLDSLRINGTAMAAGRSLDAQARLAMRGLHPKPLAGYLALLGFRPVADSIAMEASATIKARPASNNPQGVTASLAIDDVRLSADQQTFAKLAKIHIEADEIDAIAAKIGTITIEGGECVAARNASGALRIAGLETIPPQTAMHETSATPVRYGLSLRELRLADLGASFTDSAVSPPAHLQAIVTELTARPRPNSTLTEINGTFAAPGVARSLHLSGPIDPLATTKTADLVFQAEGIRPDALAAYLTPLGIESELKDGRLTGTISLKAAPDAAGAYSASARLSKIALTDGEELLAMETIAIEDAGIDPANGRIRLGNVEVIGPGIAAVRDADGSIAACGLRLRPGAAGRAPSTQPVMLSTAASQPPTTSLPGIEVGKLTWRDIRLTLTDRAAGDSVAVTIDDAGLELAGLLLDLKSNATGESGTIRAWLKSPQIAPEGITIEGMIAPGPRSIAADLKIRGARLQTQPLAPYFEPFGIEPLLSNGSLAADAQLGLIGGADNSITGYVRLQNVALREGDEELLGLDELQIDRVALSGNRLTLGSVTVRHPRGRALREPDGAIVAAGFRLRLPPSNAVATPAPLTLVAQSPSESASTTGPMVVSLSKFELHNAQLQFSDQAVEPQVATTAYLSASASDLTYGDKSPSGKLSAQLSVEGILDELKIDASELNLTPGSELIKLELAGRGIRGAMLDPYLPAGMKSALSDGRVRATMLGSSLSPIAGGRGLYLDVMNVDFRDGDSPPLLALELARIAASRVDLAGDTITVEEVVVKGLEGGVTFNADGNLAAMGIAMAPASAASAAPAPAVPATLPTTMPAGDSSEALTQIVADARRALPLVTVGKLDLGVKQFTMRDQRRPGAEPMVLSNIQLKNVEPIVQGGPNADTQAPIKLALNGVIQPVVQRFDVSIDASPFAQEPVATIDIAASGIRGEGVTALAPEIAKTINGEQMTDGRFQAHIVTHAKFNRRSPRDLEFLSRPFELDVTVTDVAFRDRPDGRILAGVEAVVAESIQVDPSASRVQVKSLEITKPIAYATRQQDGIHALGFIIPLDTAADTEPVAASAIQPAEAEAPEAVATADAEKPAGEVRIDRLLISGLDLRVEDHAVDPPLIVPVNSLDVEVRDLTTAALYEDRPIRFSAVVGSDKVAFAGESADGASERELFSQITANGNLSLFPALRGYARTSISGFELTALKGEAAAMGVDLSRGIFDADINARFRDAGAMDLRSRFVMTDLQLTEPANGPIQRHLALSAPLDVVIAAVQNADGGITIPLNVPVEQGKVSGGAIVAAAAGALSQVLLEAVASAGAKVAGGVTKGVGEVVSIGGFNPLNPFAREEPQGPTVVRLAFPEGDTSLSPAERQRVEAIIEMLRKDKNAQVMIRSDLGVEDIRLAEERANPDVEDCAALAEQLRNKRAELASERAALASRATAQLASSAPSAAASIEQLREIDRRMALADEAMDRLYEMLRPGAERQKSRRTRAAAIQIAEQRLNVIHDALLSAEIPGATQRINKAAATFSLPEGDDPGAVSITVMPRKRQE